MGRPISSALELRNLEKSVERTNVLETHNFVSFVSFVVREI